MPDAGQMQSTQAGRARPDRTAKQIQLPTRHEGLALPPARELTPSRNHPPSPSSVAYKGSSIPTATHSRPPSNRPHNLSLTRQAPTALHCTAPHRPCLTPTPPVVRPSNTAEDRFSTQHILCLRRPKPNPPASVSPPASQLSPVLRCDNHDDES